MRLLTELKRRNVIRVGAAYIVTSWLLIQVAETIFPLFGFGDAPARIVVIVLAIGFIPALIVSWAFELTPEGLKREGAASEAQPSPAGEHKTFDRLIMVVLALALGYFAFDKFVLDPARDAAREARIAEQARSEAIIGSYGQNSLAVLPFVNMSNDAGNEYFSDGVAEEVLNLLAKIPDLRVISRSSSFAFRGKDMDIPSIAERLNVAMVLEGSVRRYGDQVRITAQLIEAGSDTHLWSDTYERKLENVFAIQDEISAAIVESLQDVIDLQVAEAPTMTATTSTEAHDAYLRGRYLMAKREMAGAVSEFQKAISLEPDYALAHAQLAIAYQLGYLGITFTEMAEKATPHVEKAMELGPSLAETHAAAGNLALTWENNLEALEHFENALRINPNYADVYIWMANTLDWSLGRYAEAFALREKAVKIDPLSITALFNYASALMARGRNAEAERELEKLALLAPDVHAEFESGVLLGKGEWASATLGRLASHQSAQADLSWLVFPLTVMGLEKEAIAAGAARRPSLLIALGKPQQAVATAQAYLERDPLADWARSGVGLSLAAAGEFAEARPYLEALWQKYGIVFQGPRFNIHHATALIAVYRAAGEEGKVVELIDGIRDNVRRYAEAGISGSSGQAGPVYEDGLVRLMSGDDHQGIELITRAVQAGYVIPPGVAYLEFLYDHPGFAAIRAFQEERQSREREKFLDVVCSDNTYSASWRPEDGTCERYVSEDDS
ncbi:MAG: hypothetical protein R3348_07245 [Xanthomonadales bacterium]|nr:hypothetical protein [Xanthomonadales bacterium]